MDKQRGGSGRQATQRIGSSWGLVIMVAIVVAVVGASAVVVVLDARQQAASGPPSGIEEFEVPTPNHTMAEVSYEQSPPVGGDHNPIWQNSGFYDEPVRNETAVHTLEHGAVWITYSPDLAQEDKDGIRELVSGQDCILASPYPGLDAPVVVSAWGKQLVLEGADDPDLERFVRAFRRGPQTPEPGAACTGGVGEPI